mgnify:CR=1 FL=1
MARSGEAPFAQSWYGVDNSINSRFKAGRERHLITALGKSAKEKKRYRKQLEL